MNLKEYYKNRLNSLLEGNPLQMDPLPSSDSDNRNDKSSVSPFRRALKTDELVGTNQFDPETNFRNAFFSKSEKSGYPNATTRRNEFVKSQRTVAQPAPLTSDRPTADNASDFTRGLHTDYLERQVAKQETEANKPKTGKTTMNPQFNPGV